MRRSLKLPRVAVVASVCGAAAIASTVLVSGGVPATAQGTAKAAPKGHEVTVTIKRVRALDKIDQLSKPDFLARVTIAGRPQTVPRVREGEDISPNWRFTESVPPGRHAVRIEIFDKDLSKNEPIDINRLPNKRMQDFVVDTRSCRIQGFAGSPRCGTDIVRGGDEPKKAEVTFDVTVRK